MIKRVYTKGCENINWGGKFIFGVCISAIAIILTCIFINNCRSSMDGRS